MVIDEIDIGRPALRKAENDAPIGVYGDRPKSPELSREGVKLGSCAPTADAVRLHHVEIEAGAAPPSFERPYRVIGHVQVATVLSRAGPDEGDVAEPLLDGLLYPGDAVTQ